MSEDPWASGVLDPAVHEPLVRGLDKYAKLAGIHRAWVWRPLSSSVGPEEVEWVRDYHLMGDRGIQGILYVGGGVPGKGATTGIRMQALAGALVRNFVDARVRTVDSLVDPEGDPSDRTCSALLIPDLLVGGSHSGWVVASISSLLVERQAAGRQTVVYVSTLKGAQESYGRDVINLIRAHYLEVQV